MARALANCWPTWSRIRKMMEQHVGRAPVELHLGNGGGTEARLRSRSLTLNPSPHLLEGLKELLGAGWIRMTRV